MKATGAILMKMAVLLKEMRLRHVENHDMESFPFWKTIIDRFSNRKMSENENSARPRCDFIYTKNFARPRSDVIYTKNFQEGWCDSCLTVSVLRVRFLCGNRWGRSWRKWPFPLRKTRCVFYDFSWFFMIFHDFSWFFMIFKWFLIIFDDFFMGAILKKMAISFKENALRVGPM